jgi:phosphopantetheine--protein transferase-like protein
MKGIGIDIVSIERMERVFSETFKRRVFTEREIADAEETDRPIHHYATTFAGKEAVFKALGSGWVEGKMIEIGRDDRGRPAVTLHGIDEDVEEVLLGLSFETDYAIAIALLG